MADAVGDGKCQSDHERLDGADVPRLDGLANGTLELRVFAQITESKHRNQHIHQNIGQRVLLMIFVGGHGLSLSGMGYKKQGGPAMGPPCR